MRMQIKILAIFGTALVLTAAAPAIAQSLEQVSESELNQVESFIQKLEESRLSSSPSYNNDFNLDIVWKTNTLLAYDYAGKALPGPFSLVMVQALADFPNPDELVYTWIMDDISSTREGPELTGRAQDRFNFTAFRIPGFTHKIRVTAFDPKTERSAGVSLEIKVAKPEVYFYAESNNNFNNKAEGILRLIRETEKKIMVRPFYFKTLSVNDLDFKWFVNSSPHQNVNSDPKILPILVGSQVPVGMENNLKLEVFNKKALKEVNEKASARINLLISQ